MRSTRRLRFSGPHVLYYGWTRFGSMTIPTFFCLTVAP